MKRIINALSLVAMLLVFAGCGGSLTNTTYTFQDEFGNICAIKCYDNGKVLITEINSSDVDINNLPVLYMCYGDYGNSEIKEYRREGKTIKLIEGGIINDAFTFDNNIIKWKGKEFKPNERFSSIKNSGKYGGTVYEAKYDRETLYFVFIDDTKVFQIDGKWKILCNYETEDGKVFIDNVNMVLEEAKDKLLYNQSFQSLIFKKIMNLDDLTFHEEFGNRRTSTYYK